MFIATCSFTGGRQANTAKHFTS